ncbi:deoxyribodipyrimidine photo-lyase [Luteitalea pratensis]|uniref:deoxyribodipyrimidine photo-lyase n=1 Tax=Luteitalea pratensis TaxID=1855912 RepID=UPI001F2154C5|nr:deoxyribodipyrimidine photo-lyase [Luteitalea pratensis]
MAAPASRVRVLRDAPPRRAARYVLYWMIAARRLEDNFALQHAAWWASELDLPLLIFEPLRVGYPWASDRLHAFVLQGMSEHRAAAGRLGVTYFAYVEPRPDAGKGVLRRLAADAAVVVTDDYPTFFLPRMIAAAAARLDCRLEAVDGNGLLPMRATSTVYPTAYAFRRYVQKALPAQLMQFPVRSPLEVLPRRAAPVAAEVLERWPPANDTLLRATAEGLATLPIDHSVAPSPVLTGGSTAAHVRLEEFIAHGLGRYDERNQPDSDGASGLSPWLHFGHIAAHRIFSDVASHAGWTSRQLAARGNGNREGWWGASPQVEAFLDELITWRELGFNFAANRADYDRYESLPEWARASLDAHAADRREHLYTLQQFERAETHDPVWNAAQRQLVREGRIHNYLRMLWGKKILHWTPDPREALAVMIELNNKYALDGRDPNSYSGIFWVLGRYDRPWAPRREVFGVIRYMSSENTARKLRLKNYLRTYGPDAPLPGLDPCDPDDGRMRRASSEC